MAELNHTVVARKDARAAGLKRYFTGKPCKYGHIAERQVANGVCIRCFAQISKTFRHRHPDRVRKRNERYVKAHPEWVKEQNHKFYLSHKEEISQYSTEWRINNRSRYNERLRKFKAERPHYNRNRKAKQRGNGGKHTTQEVKEIVKWQNGKCAYCRVPLAKYHVDHIVPLCAGGRNDRRNLQVLCPSCNMSKAKRDPLDFARSIGRLV